MPCKGIVNLFGIDVRDKAVKLVTCGHSVRDLLPDSSELALKYIY